MNEINDFIATQPEEQPKPRSEEEVFDDYLGKIENAFEALHLRLRVLESRLGTVENYLSYLVMQDPKLKSRFEEIATAAAPKEESNEK